MTSLLSDYQLAEVSVREAVSPVLEVSDLCIRFGQSVIVSEVAFRLYPGETVALVGGSGAGKSTVAKALAGLIAPHSGTATLRQQCEEVELFRAGRQARRAAKRHVHLVMQDPYASLPPHRRILETVAEPLTIHGVGETPDARAEIAREALLAVGLDPAKYERRLPHELSGGERQRVAFSRALVTRPAIILADEPTGMLDASLRVEVSQLMRELASTHGTAVLHITHDLALAAHTCDRIIVMASGKIVETGVTDQVLRAPQHEVTKRLLAAALRGCLRS